eukprot:54320-Chlamydomonas_euryale.AAC.2
MRLVQARPQTAHQLIEAHLNTLKRFRVFSKAPRKQPWNAVGPPWQKVWVWWAEVQRTACPELLGRQANTPVHMHDRHARHRGALSACNCCMHVLCACV